MRSKDQILLEDAYEQVLKEGIGKALGTAALAAGMSMLSPKAANAQDMDRAGIESITKPELSEEGAFEKLRSDLSNLPVGNHTSEPPVDKKILIQVANSKNEIEKQRVTDLIQQKGYKLPLVFGSARKLETPVGG